MYVYRMSHVHSSCVILLEANHICAHSTAVLTQELFIIYCTSSGTEVLCKLSEVCRAGCYQVWVVKEEDVTDKHQVAHQYECLKYTVCL